MFTNIISQILLVISIVSAPQPEQKVDIVQLPENVQEQIMDIDLDESIQMHQEIRNSCSRNGCSLAAHQ